VTAFDTPPPAPSETLTFADSFGNALPAGTNYTLTLTHTVTPNTQQPPPNTPPAQPQTFTVSQPFSVVAPEFTIDPSIVQKTYPQTGGNAGSGYCVLPHIVLDDEALPWERNIVPCSTSPDSTPWMALVVFAESELPNNTIVPMVVQDLINIGQGGTNIGPAFGTCDVDSSVLNTQCQTIQISAETFSTVMPALADLPFMAHTQTISSAAEGTGNASVLLANRLPQDLSSVTPMQFYAHLVSLEGWSGYLAPKALPATAQTVQLVTLYNWSFVAVPQPALTIETLLNGLNAGALRLPALSGNPPQEAVNRLSDGYVPLQFITTSGDETFAWYRGPFSAVQAQPLPPVGNPPVPANSATSADALTIYSADSGLFDLSYAAAWNYGRARAMADAHFAQGMLGAQQAILGAAATLARRMAMPHLADIDDPRALLAADVTRRRFGAMGEQLRGALRSGQRKADRQQMRRHVHPRELLARPDVQAAIAENVSSSTQPIMNWLGSLVNLVPVPFSHLVPYPAMLPVESIRFFVVDPGWIDALIAGATSIALQGAGSLAATALIREQFLATAVYPAAGVLLRSQLVSAWPTLVISGTGDANFAVLRDDTLSPGVRLVLFNEVPASVTLGEPYHGIQLGMDVDQSGGNLTVTPRYTSGSNIGMPNTSLPGVTPQPPAPGAAFGVFDVSGLASALGTAGPGDFGMQMIRVPYQLTFNNQQ